MKITVKSTSLFYLFIYLVVVVVCNTISFGIRTEAYTGLTIIGYISLIELIVFLVFNSIIIGRILNYSMIFTLVLFLFHFGQLMIFTFFRNIYSHVRFLLLLSAQDAFYGYKYINLAFTMITFGILLASMKPVTYRLPEKDKMFNKKYDFEQVAKDVIMVTFPIKVIIDFLTLGVSILRGGMAARIWINAFPNILIYFGKISLIGFALLLMAYQDRPAKQKRVFLFIEIYILIMMISGIRSENVGYLLVLIFLYLANRRDRIKIPTILLYGALGFLGLSFIVAVGQFRGADTRNVISLMDLFNDSLTNNNLILSLFDTCGDTGYTAQCVLSKWLPLYGPSYGDAYYLGWLSIVPNIPGVFTLPGEITASSYFAHKLQLSGTLSSSYLNIGGSLIGEQYFNFGLVGGAIAFVIIGILIGWISYKSAYYMEIKNYYGMIKFIPIMFAAIYWVRDYFGGGLREVVWGPLVCIIIISIFRRYSTNQSNGSQQLNPRIMAKRKTREYDSKKVL